MTLDIFIPFWGDPGMLRETVASVLAQNDGDWHLTVVDDAYPDRSAGAFIAELGDDRVTYVRNEKNLGITDNFRRCVDLATRDHVVMLGCDDILLPNYVATIRAALQWSPGVDVIQPGVRVINEHGAAVSTLVDTVKRRVAMPRGHGRRVLQGEPLAASLLRADWLYWPSLVFRLDVISRTMFRDGLPIIQDLALVIDIVCAGGTLLVEPTVCFCYRRHSASASGGQVLDGSRFVGEKKYFDLAAEQVATIGWRRAERAARYHLTSRAHALSIAPSALLHGNTRTALALGKHVFGRPRPRAHPHAPPRFS
jgi:hypothetical protein